MTLRLRLFRNGAIAAAAVFAALLLAAGPASAVTRYAAPGGTATPAECTSLGGPYCSIGAAAGGTGVVAADEAVILPGDYSDTAGDLDGDTGNPTDGIVQPAAASVHGVPGQSRPVITLNEGDPMFPNPYGAFLLGPTTLSHVEIVTAVANGNVTLGDAGSVVDGVIARNSRDGSAIACNHWHGILRNSVCLSSGSNGIAAGASLAVAGTFTIYLRNVTAISTGSGSFGLNYFFGTFSPPGPSYTISAKAVIGQGTSQDVFARAGTASTVAVNLDHSNYDTASTATSGGGVATVTPAGTGAPNFNVTDPASLAADGYHQLAGSSTIDAGATDGFSGATDIDGQARQIGLMPADIGADEAGIGTVTTVSCAPAPLVLGGSATCTATVTAAAEFINGTVAFSSSAPGSFSGGGTCALPSATGSTECALGYTPSQPGTHQISAAYSGSTLHEPSQGSTPLTVSRPPSGGAGPGQPGTTPRKKCRKKRAKKGGAVAAKKRKCKKKKRK